MSEVGYSDIKRIILAAVEIIRENHQELSRLDSATGDGDHGTTIMTTLLNVYEVQKCHEVDLHRTR